MAEPFGVSTRHGIFVDDRTAGDRVRVCRYVPYPDLSSIDSFLPRSMPANEVTTRWEPRRNKVPILVIEAKNIPPKFIKSKL